MPENHWGSCDGDCIDISIVDVNNVGENVEMYLYWIANYKGFEWQFGCLVPNFAHLNFFPICD